MASRAPGHSRPSSAEAASNSATGVAGTSRRVPPPSLADPSSSPPTSSRPVSRSVNSPASSRRPVASASKPNNAINRVTYKQATIKALIDPALPLADVIRQLCANVHLGVQEPPALFALRDEQTDELVTDANMRSKIMSGCNLCLCSSPTIEAVEMVDKLSSSLSTSSRTSGGQPALSSSQNTASGLKLALYNLQRLVRERPFSDEFLKRGGLEDLLDIVGALEGGNMLAYALCCLANLMEARGGWAHVGEEVGRKVVRILATQDRINVCRPATAILKKLVLSGPQQPMDYAQRGKMSSATTTGASLAAAAAVAAAAAEMDGYVEDDDDEEINQFGFDFVYAEIKKEPNFLNTLVQRLNSADTTLCLFSLSLINSLMRNVTDTFFEQFISELEKLGVSRSVAGLMESNCSDELSNAILEYQSNTVRTAHRRLRTPVTPSDKRHVSALSYIWLSARISDANSADAAADDDTGASLPLLPSLSGADSGSVPSATSRYKWRRLGFDTENVTKEFSRCGWLGLMCCEGFVRSDPDGFAKIIKEQIARPASRRCPWGRASLEVVEILSEHYEVDSGYGASTSFKPFLLTFPRLHALALRFFLRIWNDSGAAAPDFSRVAALVRNQVKESLRDEGGSAVVAAGLDPGVARSTDASAAAGAARGAGGIKAWSEVERDFVESEYRDVRERQMKRLEVEDELGAKPSVRKLRARLYRESYEYVCQQRIHCLLEGAWFRNPASVGLGTSAASRAGGGGGGGASMPFSPSSSSSRGGPGVGGASAAGAARPWRFYRLSPDRRYLHYCDAPERVAIRSGLDDLPERVDLNAVADVVALPSAGATGRVATGAGAGAGAASLCLSLLRAPEGSLAELVALNASQFSEWSDGLRMLLDGGGGGNVAGWPAMGSSGAGASSVGAGATGGAHSASAGLGHNADDVAGGGGAIDSGAAMVSTRETADYIQILTDIGVKVKLLDITGEKIDIPTTLPPAPLPNSTSFFFADL